MARDTIVFDTSKLIRATVRQGLLRGEVQRSAGISSTTSSKAFQGHPVGIKAARSIARVLGIRFAELLASDAVGGAAT